MSGISSSKRRQQRVRAALRQKSAGRPRLTVFRSNKNIYAQIVDDAEGRTIVSASTLENSEALADPGLAKKEASSVVGRVVAVSVVVEIAVIVLLVR